MATIPQHARQGSSGGGRHPIAEVQRLRRALATATRQYAELAAMATTRAAEPGWAEGWREGWDAAVDALADHIGGRVHPAHPTATELVRWTRHHPACDTYRATRGYLPPCTGEHGCIPGPRADFGTPAPWEQEAGR